MGSLLECWQRVSKNQGQVIVNLVYLDLPWRKVEQCCAIAFFFGFGRWDQAACGLGLRFGHWGKYLFGH